MRTGCNRGEVNGIVDGVARVGANCQFPGDQVVARVRTAGAEGRILDEGNAQADITARIITREAQRIVFTDRIELRLCCGTCQTDARDAVFRSITRADDRRQPGGICVVGNEQVGGNRRTRTDAAQGDQRIFGRETQLLPVEIDVDPRT